MLWLNHPKYVRIRDDLIKYLESASYRFRAASPVMFLCGAAQSTARDALRGYFLRHRPELNLFYAERVWEQIASDTDRSALEMESQLASLADLVAVVVESPGTFAELGAFSLSKPLREKILAVVDSRYRHQPSFITTGPLRWIDAASLFRPTIYARLECILEAIGEIEERIGRIPPSSNVRIDDLASSPKHLLFFLCDLVSVIHPATLEMIQYYLGRIAPSTLAGGIGISTLTGLGVAMGLLRCNNIATRDGNREFFSPGMTDAIDHPFQHRRTLNLPTQRAAHVSVLLAVPEAKAVLEEIRRA